MRPVTVNSLKFLVSVAHPRTQFGAGLQFGVGTLLHAVSKLGKLDYPVGGMPSGFEVFLLLKLGVAQ